MSPPRNADLKDWPSVPQADLKAWPVRSPFVLAARDIAGALIVAFIVLGSSFAAGLIETLLRRYF